MNEKLEKPKPFLENTDLMSFWNAVFFLARFEEFDRFEIIDIINLANGLHLKKYGRMITFSDNKNYDYVELLDLLETFEFEDVFFKQDKNQIMKIRKDIFAPHDFYLSESDKECLLEARKEYKDFSSGE
jgi:hypothetical protein